MSAGAIHPSGISVAAATSKALTHELFYEYAHQGNIGVSELLTLARDMGALCPHLSMPSNREIGKVLTMLDRDGNQQIDEGEFTQWLAGGAQKTRAQREAVAAKSDMQRRFINLLEAVLQWLEPTDEKVREIFVAADHHDGHLNRGDLQRLTRAVAQRGRPGQEFPTNDEDVDSLMDMIDNDRSGSIEQNEFVDWLKKGIAFMRALDGPQRVQHAQKAPFNAKLINLYESLVDNWSTASKITHEFGPGSLGLTFKPEEENGVTVIHVLSIKQGGAASQCTALRRGDIITAVGGESVAGLGIKDVVTMIQKAPRPLRLCFRHVDHARMAYLEAQHRVVQREKSARKIDAQGIPDDEAAAKIQAMHRGRQTRRELRERDEAAAKIQAVQRGKQTRQEKRDRDEAAAKIQAVQRGKQARKERQERDEAAARIQAVQRGRKARQTQRTNGAKQLEKIRLVWKKMDRGNQGWVGAEDVLKGFRMLGATTMTPPEARELARYMSVNGDGRVTKAEFEKYCLTSLANPPSQPRQPKQAKRSPAVQARQRRVRHPRSGEKPSPSLQQPRGAAAGPTPPGPTDSPPAPQIVLSTLDVGEADEQETPINLEPMRMTPMEESFEAYGTFNAGDEVPVRPTRDPREEKDRMAARSRRVLKSLPPATQRELHAIHELRSLTDTKNIPPSVIGNLHSLDPLQQVAACKRVQHMINNWVSAPLKDLLNEAIDWAEEQTYDELMATTRRTPLAAPSFDSRNSPAGAEVAGDSILATQPVLASSRVIEGAGAVEVDKQLRNEMIRALDSRVRKALREIHQLATIKNISIHDLERLVVLTVDRQLHVLKRTRNMLLGEFQDERAEVVLRKALPSARVEAARRRGELGRREKAGDGGALPRRGGGGAKGQKAGAGGAPPRRGGAAKSGYAERAKKNRGGRAKADAAESMGSHHSTVQPGYSYSPRQSPPPHRQQQGYFQSGRFGPQLGGGPSNFEGAVYYNEGSPIAVFAGQEALRTFPQYYNRRAQ